MTMESLETSLSPLQVKELLETQDSVELVHVLPSGHFDTIHIPGAKNACVFEVNFAQQMEEAIPDKNTLVIVYGSGGKYQDANAAREKLLRLGYGKVHILGGGLRAWNEAKLELAGDPQAIFDNLAPDLPRGSFVLNTDASTIRWTGRNINGGHTGFISFQSGVLTIRQGHISGEFVVDMQSIVNTDLEGDESQPALIAHLMSDDFFYVEKYPTASFVLKSAEMLPRAHLTNPNYGMSGTMNIREVSLPMELETLALATPDGGLVCESHFDFDRTEFGAIYGSTAYFEHLDYHKVFDHISLEMRLLLEPK